MHSRTDFQISLMDEQLIRKEVASRIGTYADAIEVLVALRNLLDRDADQEDDGVAEPSLGWTKTMALGSSDDLEELLHDDVCPAQRGAQ